LAVVGVIFQPLNRTALLLTGLEKGNGSSISSLKPSN